MSANQSNSIEPSDGSRRKANLPWVEKYRPNALEELISHDDIVRTIRKFISQVCKYVCTGKLRFKKPHLFFLKLTLI
jgi:hypothetical protein